MRIFFLTLAYPSDPADRNLYSDLMEEIVSRGHEVHVFKPEEGRAWAAPTQHTRAGVQVHGIPAPRIQKTGAIQKVLGTFWFQYRLRKAIVAAARTHPLDVLLYATPPVDIAKTVAAVKRATGCTTYLLLKDIFPANAVDLGMFARGGLIWRHFRRQETLLYRSSDRIGCMSPANRTYLLAHNPGLDPGRVEICPNSIRPTPLEALPEPDRTLPGQLGIPRARLNLLYGGNLGKPQGIGFLLEVLAATQSDPDLHITIVGDGTEYSRLKAFKEQTGHPFSLIQRLPKAQFHGLLRSADAGLIFLDHRFTIPNFPSRLLDYLDFGIPVLAATDPHTDLGQFLEQSGSGLWSQAGDLSGFLAHLDVLKNPAIRAGMAERARAALEAQFSVQRGASILLNGLH